MLDRLAQVGIDADLATTNNISRIANRGEHDDRGGGKTGIAFQSSRECKPVDVGHLAVGDHDVKLLRPVGGASEKSQCARRVGDRRRCHAPAREHLVEDAAIGGIVIDHEHAQALERFPADRARRGRGLVRRVEVGGEMKRAALADGAFDPHPAVHQLHEPLRDRQTEAGAAIAARGGAVRLREGLENLFLLLRRNADAGVGHGKVQRHPARAPDARPSRAAPLRRQR